MNLFYNGVFSVNHTTNNNGGILQTWQFDKLLQLRNAEFFLGGGGFAFFFRLLFFFFFDDALKYWTDNNILAYIKQDLC